MRLLIPLVLVIAVSGCSALADEDDGTVNVTAAFYPLAYVSERVAGDLADVENLTQPGGEPHDLELSPQQTASIVGADLVVHEAGFQPAVDDSVEQNAEGEVLDAASAVGLERFEDEHEADDEEHSAEDEHEDHGDLDPHFWQDPLRMAELGDAVADALAEVDEAHAENYRANAADLRADLEALDTAYADGLAACATDTVVVSHDAFGYLARYGLDFEPVAGLSPDAEPTPADLGRLQELIRDRGITTVFSERLSSSRITESLADDLGISTAVLDPLEGLSDETADDDYLSLMTQNLTALEKANGCR